MYGDDDIYNRYCGACGLGYDTDGHDCELDDTTNPKDTTMLTTLPLRTLLAIAHNEIEPPAGFIAVNWHAGIETLDNLRAEWASTPATFTESELDEEVPIITEDVALAEAEDAAFEILAEHVGSLLWDLADLFIVDSRGRDGVTVRRARDRDGNRAIVCDLEEHRRDADGEIVDTITLARVMVAALGTNNHENRWTGETRTTVWPIG